MSRKPHIWTSTSYYRAYRPLRGQNQRRQRGIVSVCLVEQRHAVHTVHLQVVNNEVQQQRCVHQRLLGTPHAVTV